MYTGILFKIELFWRINRWEICGSFHCEAKELVLGLLVYSDEIRNEKRIKNGQISGFVEKQTSRMSAKLANFGLKLKINNLMNKK